MSQEGRDQGSEPRAPAFSSAGITHREVVGCPEQSLASGHWICFQKGLFLSLPCLMSFHHIWQKIDLFSKVKLYVKGSANIVFICLKPYYIVYCGGLVGKSLGTCYYLFIWPKLSLRHRCVLRLQLDRSHATVTCVFETRAHTWKKQFAGIPWRSTG